LSISSTIAASKVESTLTNDKEKREMKAWFKKTLHDNVHTYKPSIIQQVTQLKGGIKV
jgi:hypothetical protein